MTYTPPVYNTLSFDLGNDYTAPIFNNVDFDLGPSLSHNILTGVPVLDSFYVSIYTRVDGIVSGIPIVEAIPYIPTPADIVTGSVIIGSTNANRLIELANILTNFPEVDSVLGLHSVDNITTESPEVNVVLCDSNYRKPEDILAEPYILEVPIVTENLSIVTPPYEIDQVKAFILFNVDAGSIISGNPILEAVNSYMYQYPANIVFGAAVVPSVSAWCVIGVNSIFTDAVSIGEAHAIPALTFGDISFNTPNTSFYMYGDDTVLFYTPKITMDMLADTSIVASLSGKIGKTTLGAVADTEIIATIGFDIPTTSMTAFTDAGIFALIGMSTMTSISENRAVVSLNFPTPKTTIFIDAINQPVANINFNTPQTIFDGIALAQSLANMSGTPGASTCMMSAINGAICSISIDLPKTKCAVTGYSNGSNNISFTTPVSSMVATILNYTDEVLRHVRGRVR